MQAGFLEQTSMFVLPKKETNELRTLLLLLLCAWSVIVYPREKDNAGNRDKVNQEKLVIVPSFTCFPMPGVTRKEVRQLVPMMRP